MRILPGTPKEFANETPTSLHMGKFMVSNPEILPTITTLFDKNISAFSSLLARRNMMSGKLTDPLNPKNKNYKTVGNRKVMWNVKGYPDRKARIIGYGGVGFKCDASPSEPGKYQTIIDVYLDTNWFSPREVIELADNRSQLFIYDSKLPEEVEGGVWRYRMKVNTNENGDFINPNLLSIGMEMSVSHNQYEECQKQHMKNTHLMKRHIHI
jgi:hypothetical protein